LAVLQLLLIIGVGIYFFVNFEEVPESEPEDVKLIEISNWVPSVFDWQIMP